MIESGADSVPEWTLSLDRLGSRDRENGDGRSFLLHSERSVGGRCSVVSFRAGGKRVRVIDGEEHIFLCNTESENSHSITKAEDEESTDNKHDAHARLKKVQSANEVATGDGGSREIDNLQNSVGSGRDAIMQEQTLTYKVFDVADID